MNLENSPQQPLFNSSESNSTVVEPEQITQAELESRFPDKVCTPCLEQNLIESGVCETFNTCPRCNEEFCIHSVSKLDPQFCILCCNDFKIIDVIESQQRPIHSEKGELLAVRKFKVRHITLSGKHWLFANRQISTLTDIELDHAIEYHQSIYHGMIFEREGRFVKRIQRNKGKHASNENTNTVADPFVTTPDGVQFVTTQQKASKIIKRKRDNISAQSSISNGATTTKTTKVSQSKVDSLIATLLKAGMTMEQIAAIGKK